MDRTRNEPDTERGPDQTEYYADRAARRKRAFPHGPDDPCTCDGYTTHRNTWGTPAGRCYCWPGRVVGCTCDIEWDWDS